MPRFLVLRFDAPLMSFGWPAVDAHRVSDDHPGLSLVTGLLGNALGYRHGDGSRLQALQSRLHLASRQDRAGERLVDYHTVDLGQEFMRDTGWTTRGMRQDRAGGPARTGTHQRFQHYVADAVYTVVIGLAAPNDAPTLDHLAAALRRPARPLFVGRKACLPAAPILVGECIAERLRDALRDAPWTGASRSADRAAAWWPAAPGEGRDGADRIAVHDARDWENQLHVGRRFLRRGFVDRPGEEGS